MTKLNPRFWPIARNDAGAAITTTKPRGKRLDVHKQSADGTYHLIFTATLDGVRYMLSLHVEACVRIENELEALGRCELSLRQPFGFDGKWLVLPAVEA